jgi:cytochrome b561
VPGRGGRGRAATGTLAGIGRSTANPTERRASDRHAYGRATRALHWSTVIALAGQFTIGYLLDVEGGRGRGRGRGRGSEGGSEGGGGRGRGRGGDDLDVFADGLLTAHVALGATIMALGLVRLWWRRRTTLPPWAAGLSAFERRLAHWTERALYALLLVIPATGLWLVLVSDDAVGVHVAAHVAFFVAVASHVGLVLKHQLLDRDGLLRRML